MKGHDGARGPDAADRITLRSATARDEPWLRRAAHAAWRWRTAWDEADFVAHSALGGADSYVDGFGRQPGDLGVVAVRSSGTAEEFVGAAWCRCFTEATARAGFVATDVPEVVLAVEEGERGRGIGRSLLIELVHRAHEVGTSRLSLHVSEENHRARGLYESVGFVDSGEGDGRGAVLVLAVGESGGETLRQDSNLRPTPYGGAALPD